MSGIQDGIILNEDKTLSFGNYEIEEKLKIDKFEVLGDIYKLKTCKEITRLSKNDKLVLETVPGACIHNFSLKENITSFYIEGKGDTLITLELEPNTNYSLYVNEVNIDKIKTNLAGKINFSATLLKDKQFVKIHKND